MLAVSVFLSGVLLANAVQLPLGSGVDYPMGFVGSEGVASGGEATLSALSGDEFTLFTHPSVPSYGLRIKQLPAEFCDSSAKSYTGYLDVDYGTKHMFFYFFESRSDPDKDDVLMWINGGPGCSSSLGLFMELGPCSVEEPLANGLNGTKWNPHSWNSNTNLFFLDQPVGVGFSYADFGQTVGTTEDAAGHVDAFVTLFFETFSKFKGRPFHMSGESYGGRYLPVFASAIVDSNTRARAENRTEINLKSVLIGNGFTDFATMTPSYYDMMCTAASVEPFLDIATCVSIKKALPRCEAWVKKECLDRYDAIGCEAAYRFCDSLMSPAFDATGMNPYDISKMCEGGIETLCYPMVDKIATYLDQPHIRKVLGVDQSIGNYSACSDQVGRSFGIHLDPLQLTYLYIGALLERGIKILIYAGVYDWICNFKGNERWVHALEWTGGDAFNAAKYRKWQVDGKAAGDVKSAKGLTFATVFEAGHMVPYDKPVQALAMLQRWLANGDLV